jgi:hypothetical protein
MNFKIFSPKNLAKILARASTSFSPKLIPEKLDSPQQEEEEDKSLQTGS